MKKEVIDRQLECIAIAKTVPKAFDMALNRLGSERISSLDLTHYTLFFNPENGHVTFDLNWDQGEAYSNSELAYCQQTNLIVAGYYSQHEITTLSLWELGERIFDGLKTVDLDCLIVY
ncbi:hypothetical protein [Larkinella rosea]|uniref:Uncharacterized protein n=1 Tax=Larkinella rosea TaxID=2025312 RepID=A0A3P1BPC2_9BACT|nr:hypothetical protein [Larkinella rosea]RRB02898.1 hypothetical protein EHT25_20900 [Larkinella rosea]